MIKIGVTGGIGSGKSTVCKLLELLQVPVYYADDRAKWLMQHDARCKKAIIAQFGSEAYHESGLINREFLAREVFSNEAQRQKINAIVHPAVAADFSQWLADHAHCEVVAKEAALLIETESYRELDALWVVEAPEAVRLKRVLARDAHRSKADVLRIMASQLSDEQRREHADVVIHNDDQHGLMEAVLHYLNELKGKRPSF